MKKSWTARYLGTFILVLCGSLFLFALLAGRKMNETLTTMYKSHLQWTADLMETVLITSTDDGALEDFIHPGSLNETATRLTIITPDGTVVGDSHYDARLLDNHGDRPEVRRALAGKADYSLRWSDTLKTDMMYYAKPVTLSNGKMYV
ncbi:MAG: hypothetical protein JW760_08495, partial [Spirochaetales bacterium]|nr:hypothetical protein [Spirochaetales bacterium]